MRIEPVIEAEAVSARIAELGQRLYRDYSDSPLTVLCIAEGARRFVDALLEDLRARGLVPEPERVDVKAERTEGTELGPVQVEGFDPEQLDDRDVLVVDDVADQGSTLRAVLEILALAEPRTVRTAVLVDKPERREEPLALDYVGFRVERGWVVGYGMDADGAYRELDWIGVLVDD